MVNSNWLTRWLTRGCKVSDAEYQMQNIRAKSRNVAIHPGGQHPSCGRIVTAIVIGKVDPAAIKAIAPMPLSCRYQPITQSQTISQTAIANSIPKRESAQKRNLQKEFGTQFDRIYSSGLPK